MDALDLRKGSDGGIIYTRGMVRRTPRTAQLAEDEFQRLCNAAGVYCNRVRDDQTGWDFVVEFPPEPSPLPPDLRPAGLTCFVQVKSAQGSKASTEVKLSNAVRFAQHAVPCFTILFRFKEGQVGPFDARLQHFWLEQIEGALGAARAAGVANTPLHRVRLPVYFSAHEACAPEDLVARMEAAIVSIGPDYAGQKAEYAKSAGYEAGHTHGEITFAEGVEPEDIVDLMLGLVTELPTAAFTLSDIRFGQPVVMADQLGPGKFEVDPAPTESCLVVLSPVDGGEEITLEGAVIVPGIQGLAEHLRRVRIVTDVFEVILGSRGQTRIISSIEPERPLNLSVLDKIAAFRAWAGAGEFRLAIWARNRLMVQGKVAFDPPTPPEPWVRLRYVTRGLLRIVPEARWPSTALFSISQVFEELDDLIEFVGHVTEPGTTLTIIDVGGDVGEVLAASPIYIGPAAIGFLDVSVFAATKSQIMTRSTEDGTLTLTLGQPVILRSAALVGTLEDHLVWMDAEFNAARDSSRAGSAVLSRNLIACHDGHPGLTKDI